MLDLKERKPLLAKPIDKAVINYHHDRHGWIVLGFTCIDNAFAHAGLLQHQYPNEVFTITILRGGKIDKTKN